MQPGSKPDNEKFPILRAFHYPNFRYMWLGQLGHSAAMWMDQILRPLLILEMTGSALQVGLVVSLMMIPALFFGLFAGVIADRYNKRNVLIINQLITLVMHLTLAALYLTGHLEVWHVYVTAFITGASMSFNQPTRQSMIPRVVPREIMFNAISLNNMAHHIMRIAGASLAGLLLIFFNYGEIYLVTALIFAAVIWVTYKIRLADSVTAPSPEKPIKAKTTLFSELIDGFRYVAHNPVIFYMVGLALLIYIFFMPYQQVYVPLLALNVLDVGRAGTGWLLTFSGIGALAGSLVVASLRQVHRRGLIQIGLLIAISGAMLLLAQSRWFPLSALAMFLCGGICTAYIALNTAILMEKSDPKYSGRVMSLMSLDRGFVSLGAVMAGGLAELVGPQTGLTIFAAVLFTLTILMFIVFRRFRNIV